MAAGSKRLRSIDFLRGFAALGVVFYHVVGECPSAGGVLLRAVSCICRYGYLGVPLFFVISGFCIHLGTAKKRVSSSTAKVDFVGFWRRRIMRLYPPYLAMLCISMGMLLVASLMHIETEMLSLYPEPQWKWMLGDFAAHATMLHGVIPLFDHAGGNGPFWTLAREEYFYMMYFLLLMLLSRLGPLKMCIAVVISSIVVPNALAGLTQNHHDLSLVGILGYAINPVDSALALWGQWVLGMLAAEAYVGLVKFPRILSNPIMCIVLLVFAAAVTRYVSLQPTVKSYMWGAAFFVLLNTCVMLEVQGRWRDFWIVNRIAGVGLFSYSLYLTHNPVVSALGAFERIARSRLQIIHVTDLYTAVVMIIVTALSVAIGWGFFMLVERWFILEKKPAPVTQ